MEKFRYILQKYSGSNSRKICPSCRHITRTFVLYIDVEKNNYVNPIVGRCNRENTCGYHYTPRQYFQDNGGTYIPISSIKKAYARQEVISFIPHRFFTESLRKYSANNFVRFLNNLFNYDTTKKLVSSYLIGTAKHWDGASVFWQIDMDFRVRTGKIMLYDEYNGKRVKSRFSRITWVHKTIKQPSYKLKQCLFGEHLLISSKKTVAIVESEKTAVIASAYIPQFTWLATGGLNFNAKKLSILKGRKVILFPDLNGYDKWKTKAIELSNIADIKVSDLLERKSNNLEKKEGLDLADYLIKFNHPNFINNYS